VPTDAPDAAGASRYRLVSVGVGRCWLVSVGVGRCWSVLVGVGRCWSVLIGVCRCSSVSVRVRPCRSVLAPPPRRRRPSFAPKLFAPSRLCVISSLVVTSFPRCTRERPCFSKLRFVIAPQRTRGSKTSSLLPYNRSLCSLCSLWLKTLFLPFILSSTSSTVSSSSSPPILNPSLVSRQRLSAS